MVFLGDKGRDAMTAQLRAAGVAVEADAQPYPNGRFARLHGPEGDPVELQQPAGRDAASSPSILLCFSVGFSHRQRPRLGCFCWPPASTSTS